MHYNYLSCPPHEPAWDWRKLVHVCQRWRKVIFDSPHRLDLRILCTYQTPVRKNLSIWPALPIVLDLCSLRLLSPQYEDNLITALEHRDRVYSITLFTTGSQLAKLAAVMQGPFPVLTNLSMHSSDEYLPDLTAEFLGGSAPNLQRIALGRIPFPALPTLLLSTSELVTLNLFDLPAPGYISPERMVMCLAALPRLETFIIKFEPSSPRPDRIRPPPVERHVLPALSFFDFQGAFEYLEALAAQIHSPRLEWVSIKYWEPPDDFQVMQLSGFIDRSIGPELTPSRHANIHFDCDRLIVTLSREYPHASYPDCNRGTVETSISFDAFNWHRPDIDWMLSQCSVALCTVAHLEIKVELYKADQSDDPYDIEWLHILRHFPALQTLYVSLELAAPVLEDITAEMVAEMLPSLGLICSAGELASSFEKIVAIRRFSDHPITVVETRDEFNERLKSYISI